MGSEVVENRRLPSGPDAASQLPIDPIGTVEETGPADLERRAGGPPEQREIGISEPQLPHFRGRKMKMSNLEK